MQTVCEKIPKARMLRSYVGRLAGSQDKAVRKKLLTELLELVTTVKRKQKRVF
jgi:phosphoribosyl-ATP pyrophosphohydrolase